MKRICLYIVCLLAMMAASTGLKAQEITITLEPGWNWISYPNAEVMDIASALGSFAPVEGDLIKSRYTTSRYTRGRWGGGVTHFMPGWGYMYYSNRDEMVSFVFSKTSSQFTVTTAEPVDITATSATVGGTVSIGEGNHVFARGVCWGTEEMPDVDGSHMTGVAETGSQTDSIDGLTPSTTYYVRAYVVTDHGLAYGETVSFITEADGIGGDSPTGAIDGKFAINGNGDQVYFSQGNLQYIGSAVTPYWKFADNQWDVLGVTTGQNSSDQNVDRDLFGWGTSGYHDTNDPYNVNYQPWSSSDLELNNDYNVYGYGPSTNMPDMNLTGTSANYDWGVNNPISNGGNTTNQWRTLTQSEWNYVLNTRNTISGIRFAKGQVNEVNGVILLPDDWTTDTYTLNNTNTIGASYISNVINASQWALIENAGGVFLPAAGGRYGTTVADVGSSGFYWLSSSNSSCCAYYVYFYNPGIYLVNYRRYLGRSVRLVCDVEN